MTLKVDKFGRVLLPKAIRRALALQANGALEVRLDEKRRKLYLEPGVNEAALSEQPIVRTGGSAARGKRTAIVVTDYGLPILQGNRSFPKDYNVVDAIREAREERADMTSGLS